MIRTKNFDDIFGITRGASAAPPVTNAEIRRFIEERPSFAAAQLQLGGPELTITARANATPGPEKIAAGTSTVVSVPSIVLDWHAMYTGGPVPSSNARSRTYYRLALRDTLRACLEVESGQWRATELYRRLETSEQAQASYRLGTALAGAASDIALGLPLLVHRETLFGKSSGPRGDMLGYRAVTGDWHGVEAKGKAPTLTTGHAPYVSPGDYKSAKTQAQLFARDLAQHGMLGARSDHWASTTRASTVDRLEMVLDDPPGDGDGDNDGPPPPSSDADFPQPDPHERLLQAFYQVLDEIKPLAAARTSFDDPSGPDFIGGWVPNSDIWLGARQLLFDAQGAQELRTVVGDLARSPRVLDSFRYSSMGLAVARLPGT
jgi:hypothetical protein